MITRLFKLSVFLLAVSLIIAACGEASGAVPSVTPTVPAVPTAMPVVVPTENPLNQAIEDAWPAWIEALKAETGHIFDWESGDPLGYHPTPEEKCQLFAAWEYLIPSPVESCVGGEKANLPAHDVIGLDDPYEAGLSLHAGLLEDWQAVQVLPQDGQFAMRECGSVVGYLYPYAYLSFIEMSIEGQDIEFDMPTFGLIKYDGQEYRLPEDCLSGSTEDLIRPRSEWFVTGVPTITIEQLNEQYGQFFEMTILRQFLGDPSLLIEVDGSQFLVMGDLYPQDSEGKMLWPFSSNYDIDEVPAGTGIMVVSKRWGDEPYGCFLYDRELPQISEWLDPQSLEGQYIKGVAEDICLDTLVILEDGRGGVFLYEGHVFDGAGEYAYGQFQGYAHLEFDSLNLTDLPRDPAKDAEAIRLAEEIRVLPGDWYDKPDVDDPADGPIEACWILESNWSHLPGLSAGTVEWLCGQRLSFWYRFAVTSWGSDVTSTLGPWLVFTARVPMAEPVILTTGDVRRIDFRTFIEVGSACGESSETSIQIWVNQISEGEVKTISLCVGQSEYLTVMSKASVNLETGKYYWIPEDPMVFRIR